MSPGGRSIGLRESLKEMRQKLGIDSLTRVGDADFDVRIDAFAKHMDTSAFGRKFDRIID